MRVCVWCSLLVCLLGCISQHTGTHASSVATNGPLPQGNQVVAGTPKALREHRNDDNGDDDDETRVGRSRERREEGDDGDEEIPALMSSVYLTEPPGGENSEDMVVLIVLPSQEVKDDQEAKISYVPKKLVFEDAGARNSFAHFTARKNNKVIQETAQVGRRDVAPSGENEHKHLSHQRDHEPTTKTRTRAKLKTKTETKRPPTNTPPRGDTPQGRRREPGEATTGEHSHLSLHDAGDSSSLLSHLFRTSSFYHLSRPSDWGKQGAVRDDKKTTAHLQASGKRGNQDTVEDPGKRRQRSTRRKRATTWPLEGREEVKEEEEDGRQREVATSRQFIGNLQNFFTDPGVIVVIVAFNLWFAWAAFSGFLFDPLGFFNSFGTGAPGGGGGGGGGVGSTSSGGISSSSSSSLSSPVFVSLEEAVAPPGGEPPVAEESQGPLSPDGALPGMGLLPTGGAGAPSTEASDPSPSAPAPAEVDTSPPAPPEEGTPPATEELPSPPVPSAPAGGGGTSPVPVEDVSTPSTPAPDGGAAVAPLPVSNDTSSSTPSTDTVATDLPGVGVLPGPTSPNETGATGAGTGLPPPTTEGSGGDPPTFSIASFRPSSTLGTTEEGLLAVDGAVMELLANISSSITTTESTLGQNNLPDLPPLPVPTGTLVPTYSVLYACLVLGGDVPSCVAQASKYGPLLKNNTQDSSIPRPTDEDVTPSAIADILKVHPFAQVLQGFETGDPEEGVEAVIDKTPLSENDKVVLQFLRQKNVSQSLVNKVVSQVNAIKETFKDSQVPVPLWEEKDPIRGTPTEHHDDLQKPSGKPQENPDPPLTTGKERHDLAETEGVAPVAETKLKEETNVQGKHEAGKKSGEEKTEGIKEKVNEKTIIKDENKEKNEGHDSNNKDGKGGQAETETERVRSSTDRRGLLIKSRYPHAQIVYRKIQT